MDTDFDAAVCPDWIWLNNSNVHVAKDRGWFKTYIPFASSIRHSMFTSPGDLPVLGIGTVEIPTKRSPNLSGVSSHGSLHLKQVLHVPGFICNIIGNSIGDSDGYDVETCSASRTNGTIKDGRGNNMVYFDRNRPLFNIRVRDRPEGPKLGPHALQKDTIYVISCQWDSAQQKKWLEYQAQGALGSEAAHVTDSNPPYTDAEKAFLEVNWRDEYHFLLLHGLHMHKNKDRVEDRPILRALMHEDNTEENSLDTEAADREDYDETLEDDELDLAGHQADCNFSSQQLNWIEMYYGSSKNYMISYGLKFYDTNDVEEAKAIIDVMLSEDD